MKRFAAYTLAIVLPFYLTSCGGGNSSENADNDANEMQPSTLKVERMTGSPEYPEARLMQAAPEDGALLPEGSVNFNFTVEGYELGAQTADAETKGMANSGQGQHIHLILNNGPYSAHYEPSFEKELEAGPYVSLAFLSRSYHESVKNAGAAVVTQFVVGDGAYEAADLSAPHMFYSRPKGTYVGDDTKKVLLDWYLLNCDLSETGYTVRATINGEEFVFTDWAPRTLEGLPMGENTIKLELLDATGALVESPFNPVVRKVMLKEKEAE